jgi:N-methylhydantoinase A/oxoprolinase/acetone carboxylase beta subunit
MRVLGHFSLWYRRNPVATRAAVDIRGTFTDLVCLDGEGCEVGLGRASTTHGRLESQAVKSLRRVAE